jgi:hypothetical protein
MRFQAMKIEIFRASRRVLWSAAILPFLVACQVLPPSHSAIARAGTVRAQTQAQADDVALLLDRLSPQVIALLPDSRARDIEVWIQETPALYRFSTSAYNDADGFWAAEPKRIHLRAGADDLQRTLAHELVHASLGRSWKTLPGTIEEGLCDALSAELCPASRARLRAGRLSSAAFALGGLVLELDVEVAPEAHPAALTMRYCARLRLEGDPPVEIDPMDVFRIQAGLSSTSMPSERKKAFYGLAYVATERILARRGVEGLHELCQRAEAEERDEIPSDWLLEAADLTTDRAAWHRAIVDALGPEELAELIRMHPRFLAETVADFLRTCLDPGSLESVLPWIDARLSVAGSPASLSLWTLAEVRREVERRLGDGAEDTLASR